MIKKVGTQYFVYNYTGEKRLSKGYLSKKQKPKVYKLKDINKR